MKHYITVPIMLQDKMQSYIRQNVMFNVTPFVSEILVGYPDGDFGEQYKKAVHKIAKAHNIQELNANLEGVIDKPRELSHIMKIEEYYKHLLQSLIVYEWYVVTPELADILAGNREIILQFWNMYVWGRQNTNCPLEQDDLFWTLLYEEKINF